jgi:hypothetical protein
MLHRFHYRPDDLEYCSMTDFETWAEEKRAEAFSLAVGKLTEGEYDEHAISEGMQAESDVMRALHAHGLLP